MSQTVVTFLVDPFNPDSTPVPGGTPALDNRVFDFDITKVPQTYYITLITRMQTLMNSSQPLTDAQAKEFAAYLTLLNLWSKMRFVQTTGPEAGNQVSDLNAKLLLSDPAFNAFNPVLKASAAGQAYLTSLNIDLSTPLGSTMDRYMGESLEQINRTISAAGWATDDTSLFTATTPNPNSLTTITTALNKLKSNDSIYQLSAALTKALSVAAQARVFGDASTGSQSIQQAVAVDFVATGNTILFNQMTQLKAAIDNNQSILSYLNSLQDLLNQKDPQQFTLALQKLSSQSSLIPSTSYNDFESQTFNQTLGTTSKYTFADPPGTPPNPSTPAIGDDDPILKNAFADLAHDPLSPSFDFVKTRLMHNIDILIAQLGAAGVSGTSGLVSALNTIKTDINTPATLQGWIQDFNTNTGLAGAFQTNMNNAITASQSFNDTQRAELQRVMFVYEEFYKSASALLSRITQIIEKMASFMSR